MLLAWARPQSSSFREDSRRAALASVPPTVQLRAGGTTCCKQLTNVQVWVHDQDEALAFYTEKLGMELRDDVTVPELGNFRWLTVGVPGQDVAITLMAVPGPPVFDEETARADQGADGQGCRRRALLRYRRLPGEATRSSRAAGSSSSRSRRSSPTGSTRASATRPATRCAWCSGRRSPDEQNQALSGHGADPCQACHVSGSRRALTRLAERFPNGEPV